MTKQECINILFGFVAELDCINNLTHSGKVERVELIRKINKDIIFLKRHKINGNIPQLIVDERLPQIQEFRFEEE